MSTVHGTGAPPTSEKTLEDRVSLLEAELGAGKHSVATTSERPSPGLLVETVALLESELQQSKASLDAMKVWNLRGSVLC